MASYRIVEYAPNRLVVGEVTDRGTAFSVARERARHTRGRICVETARQAIRCYKPGGQETFFGRAQKKKKRRRR